MAARLINKPRAEQEPRSAHGRAVNKPRAEQEPRSAHGRAVKKKTLCRAVPLQLCPMWQTCPLT